eukprot:183490-Amphidinium_carterae.1
MEHTRNEQKIRHADSACQRLVLLLPAQTDTFNLALKQGETNTNSTLASKSPIGEIPSLKSLGKVAGNYQMPPQAVAAKSPVAAAGVGPRGPVQAQLMDYELTIKKTALQINKP